MNVDAGGHFRLPVAAKLLRIVTWLLLTVC